MRKIIYHVAATLDGFIAHPDGRIDGFAHEGDHVAEYLTQLQAYDTVIMGRKTYEFGYAYGLEAGKAAYPHMQNYVFSSSIPVESSDEKLVIVRENALEQIIALKQEEGSPIYLCGGGAFAAFLLQEKQVDELLLKQSPMLFGSGIPLFTALPETLHLEFLSSKAYESGVLLNHYRILNQSEL